MSQQSQGNNSTATFEYKCLRCSQTFDANTTSKNTAVTIIDVVCLYGWDNAKNALNARDISHTGITRLYPHQCLDGGYGIGEMIGLKVNGA